MNDEKRTHRLFFALLVLLVLLMAAFSNVTAQPQMKKVLQQGCPLKSLAP